MRERTMNATRPHHTYTAGLPMYDPPELRAAVDAWWGGLARAFRAEGIAGVPDRLDRNLALDALWGAPDLLFTQTCGYPLFGAWVGRMQYVATPRHATDGCEGPNYCSFIVVPAHASAQSLEDLRGARCSVSARISHSGFNALRALFAPLAMGGRFFGAVSLSGGHAESLDQICAGEVDVAAIDCVTYALLSRCKPRATLATRIIGRTATAPGLPYATHSDAPPDLIERLRAGLARAFFDPELAQARSTLLLDGFDVLPTAMYDCMFEAEADAKRRRYHELD
jgi:ABC-type phosphate/phosphonate transport system substrate-binding protein